MILLRSRSLSAAAVTTSTVCHVLPGFHAERIARASGELSEFEMFAKAEALLARGLSW